MIPMKYSTLKVLGRFMFGRPKNDVPLHNSGIEIIKSTQWPSPVFRYEPRL